MSELGELFLKCPQGIEVVLFGAAGLEVSILEERVDERFARVFKLGMCDVELFLRKLAGLGKEHRYENIALADRLVIIVLHASLRHFVEKVLPANDLQINPLVD